MSDKKPLKHTLSSYPPRLARFMELISHVRSLKPVNRHMWTVMDTPAFEDTETALETTLMNAEKKDRK